MIAGRLLAIGTGAWVAYAWGAHLASFRLVRRGPRSGRRLALTFDDGPDPEWTPRILAILAAHGVRASFFLVGVRAARHPDVVRRIAAAGHDVLNHGWSHRSLWFCGPARTAAEVGRAHDLLAGLAGREPRYFRPPWGMVNAALYPVLSAHGVRGVLWSIQPEGLRPVPAGVQADHVVRRAGAGAIVDLHDTEGAAGAPARLVEALPAMIDGLREGGWDPVPLGELLAPTSSTPAPPPPR